MIDHFFRSSGAKEAVKALISSDCGNDVSPVFQALYDLPEDASDKDSDKDSTCESSGFISPDLPAPVHPAEGSVISLILEHLSSEDDGKKAAFSLALNALIRVDLPEDESSDSERMKKRRCLLSEIHFE